MSELLKNHSMHIAVPAQPIAVQRTGQRRSVVKSCVAIFAVAMLFITVSAVFAQGEESTPPETPVENARKVFTEGNTPPWYDGNEDGIRRIEVTPRETPPDPPQAADNYPPERAQPANRGNAGTGVWGSLFWSVIQALGWIAIVAILVLVAALIIHTFYSRPAEDHVHEVGVESTSQVDRVDQLPTGPIRRHDDLLAEATRLYEAGNFDEAIIYLYSYQLVELDKHQQLRLAKGKTNRQYLRELRNQPALAELIEQTMLAFERVFFGRYQLSRRQFEACWQQLPDFHQHLKPVAA